MTGEGEERGAAAAVIGVDRRCRCAGARRHDGAGHDGAGFDAAGILGIRRANRRVRSLLARQVDQARGTEARDARGRPVDPVDPDARSFSIVGAFLASARPSPWQYSAWMGHAHGAAAEMLGDPDADIFAFNDADGIGLAACMALLDEIDARVTPLVEVGGRSPGGADW